MTKDPVKAAETELLWELNVSHGIAWINKGLSIFIILLAVTNSLLWYLLFLPGLLLYPLVRKRYIYPRTGQVKLKHKPKVANVLLGGGLGLVIAMILVLLGMWMTTIPDDTMWWRLWFGLCVAFLVGNWMWFDYKAWDGKSHFPIVERILIIIALLSLFWLEPNKRTLLLLLGSYGLFNFGYGLVTFVNFIRNNPVLPNE